MLTTTVYAVIRANWVVDNTAYISATYGLKVVLDVEPYNTIISSIDWGTLLPNGQKNTFELYNNTWFRLKNTDNSKVYVDWMNSTLPSGVTLDAWLRNPDTDVWRVWSQTELLPIESSSLYPEQLDFRLQIAPGTPSQSFAFTITLNVHDSPEG